MVNDVGIIPNPQTIVYNGEEMYLVKRKEQTLMKMYNNAVGISTNVLSKMSTNKKMLVEILFSDRIERRLGNVLDFLKSNKKYMNIGSDEQKFVAINDMKLLETQPV